MCYILLVPSVLMILVIKGLFCLAIFLWLLSVLLVACFMIWRNCLPLVWHFWVHCTCCLLPSWMWVVSSWVHLDWAPHFVFFLLWPQPWQVLLFLLLQPLPALLLYWQLSVHLSLCVYAFFLPMSVYMRLFTPVTM